LRLRFQLGHKNDFWEYDPATNAWTQKANFAGLARETPVGFAIGNKGYIGCGYHFEVFSKIFMSTILSQIPGQRKPTLEERQEIALPDLPLGIRDTLAQVVMIMARQKIFGSMTHPPISGRGKQISAEAATLGIQHLR
jgi:hypothetical protein